MPAQRWKSSRRLRPSRDPFALGWSAANTELVAAVVENEQMGLVLARLHREGYGPLSRVLDGSRGNVEPELQRLGIESDLVIEQDGAQVSVVLVQSAGRTAPIHDLLRAAGISESLIFVRPPVMSTEHAPAVPPMADDAATAGVEPA